MTEGEEVGLGVFDGVGELLGVGLHEVPSGCCRTTAPQENCEDKLKTTPLHST